MRNFVTKFVLSEKILEKSGGIGRGVTFTLSVGEDGTNYASWENEEWIVPTGEVDYPQEMVDNNFKDGYWIALTYDGSEVIH
jgi:hypothetical protein